MKRWIGTVLVVVILLALAFSCFVQVNEGEIVVITQFGRTSRVVTEPGLVVKAPDPFQTTLRLDGRLQVFDSEAAEYLTKDKKNLVISSFVVWRIADAELFLRAVRTTESAQVRVGDLVSSELSIAIGTFDLSAFFRADGEETAILSLSERVLERSQARASEDFGVELVDVRVRRVNFPQQNLPSVFNRMNAEREQIAKKYRAEGEEQAAAIRSETEREVRQLLADAYREAQVTEGEGEAKAIGIYGAAYGEAPEFFRLQRTLQAYERILTGETTLILSADSPLFEYLQGPPQFDAEASSDWSALERELEAAAIAPMTPPALDGEATSALKSAAPTGSEQEAEVLKDTPTGPDEAATPSEEAPPTSATQPTYPTLDLPQGGQDEREQERYKAF